MTPDRLAAAVAQGHEDAVQAWPQEDPCGACGGDADADVAEYGMHACPAERAPAPVSPLAACCDVMCKGKRTPGCVMAAPVSSPAGEDVERVALRRLHAVHAEHYNVAYPATICTPCKDQAKILAALSARPVEAQTVRQVAKAHGIQTGDGAEAVDVLTGKRIAPEPVEAQEVERLRAELDQERVRWAEAHLALTAALARAEAAEAVIEKVREVLGVLIDTAQDALDNDGGYLAADERQQIADATEAARALLDIDGEVKP